MLVQKELRRIVAEACRKHGLKLKKLMLFGSRARGDSVPTSDWDVLVVVDQKLDRTKYRSLWKEIYGRLRCPADIIIVDWETYGREKNTVGSIPYYVSREGVDL